MRDQARTEICDVHLHRPSAGPKRLTVVTDQGRVGSWLAGGATHVRRVTVTYRRVRQGGLAPSTRRVFPLKPPSMQYPRFAPLFRGFAT